jgi:WhiB family transcriptional regulator, redox-sensing transcriptional regulator
MPDPEIDLDHYHHLLDGIWQRFSACAEPHPEANWYPTVGKQSWHTPATKAAIAICHACPVESECLTYAITTEGHRDRGIWGGMTHKQRTALKARLYKEGKLPVIRQCSNPGCAKHFRVKSRHVPRTGVCCSRACRLAVRRIRSRVSS